MRVAPEILQHLRRAAERLFGVNHPVVAVQRGDERSPGHLILCGIVAQAARKAGRVERFHELAPVHR